MILEKYKNKKLLVTGATGFIGFYLTCKLKEMGFDVLAIDNNLRGGYASAKEYFKENNINYFDIDLCNQNQINQIEEEISSVKAIFHLAAFNGTNNFYKKPYTVLNNSSLPILNLINKIISLKIKPKILYTGSSECYAYGVKKGFNSIPTNEDVTLALGSHDNPRWSYACGKLLGEYALFNAYQQYQIPFVIARVHNIYGPRMGLNHFFSDFIKRCLSGEFYIYGPNQTRSYCFIDDCVKALILLMNTDKSNFNIFNVGSPREIKNIDCAKLILNELDINHKLEFKDPPKGSTERRNPDLKKLFSIFPSLIKQTSLEEGLKSTVAWYANNNLDLDCNES